MSERTDDLLDVRKTIHSSFLFTGYARVICDRLSSGNTLRLPYKEGEKER